MGFRETAFVFAALGLAFPVCAAEWDFEPRVSVGQIWTDNIGLVPDERAESDWVTELRPGFTLGLLGPRSRARLDYDLQALWFSDNSEFDDTFHQLDGAGNFVLAENRLFLDAFARFDQNYVDSSGRIGFSNLFETGNRTNTFVFGASPYHVGRWGNWGESLVRYHYQGVRYSDTDEDVLLPEDSDTKTVSAALGSPLAARGVSWRASGSYSLTEFDQADEFEYAQVAFDVGVPVSLRMRLTGKVGQESDVEEDPTKGGLDSSYWFVGFRWEPSDLQSLEARVGERFFGTAWELHWRRRGSRGEASLDYTEQPTTSSGVLGDEGMFSPDLVPGGVGSIDPRVFIWKRLSANASYRLARSNIVAQAYTDRREFQDATGDTETSYGAILSYDWDAAARILVGARVTWEQREFETDRRDDLGEFSVHLTREFTRTVSGVLRATHFLRNSDVEENYTANQVSLFVEARF